MEPARGWYTMSGLSFCDTEWKRRASVEGRAPRSRRWPGLLAVGDRQPVAGRQEARRADVDAEDLMGERQTCPVEVHVVGDCPGALARGAEGPPGTGARLPSAQSSAKQATAEQSGAGLAMSEMQCINY